MPGGATCGIGAPPVACARRRPVLEADVASRPASRSGPRKAETEPSPPIPDGDGPWPTGTLQMTHCAIKECATGRDSYHRTAEGSTPSATAEGLRDLDVRVPHIGACKVDPCSTKSADRARVERVVPCVDLGRNRRSPAVLGGRQVIPVKRGRRKNRQKRLRHDKTALDGLLDDPSAAIPGLRSWSDPPRAHTHTQALETIWARVEVDEVGPGSSCGRPQNTP